MPKTPSAKLPPDHPKRIWQDIVDFARQIDQPLSGCSHYLFRGQADIDWHLTTPLSRTLQDADLTPEQMINIEKQASRQFTNHAHLYLPSHIMHYIETDPLICWTVMQHHGITTRLMDWTYSIYVATYFAASQRPDADGAVFCLKADLIQQPGAHVTHSGYTLQKAFEENAFENPDIDPHLFILGQSKLRIQRMGSQQGEFLACTQIAADLHELLIKTVKGEPREKASLIRIPKALKSYFLNRLRMMNITAHTLFPGIDGLGRSISEAMFMEAHRVPPGLDRRDPNHPHTIADDLPPADDAPCSP